MPVGRPKPHIELLWQMSVDLAVCGWPARFDAICLGCVDIHYRCWVGPDPSQFVVFFRRSSKKLRQHTPMTEHIIYKSTLCVELVWWGVGPPSCKVEAKTQSTGGGGIFCFPCLSVGGPVKTHFYRFLSMNMPQDLSVQGAQKNPAWVG